MSAVFPAGEQGMEGAQVIENPAHPCNFDVKGFDTPFLRFMGRLGHDTAKRARARDKRHRRGAGDHHDGPPSQGSSQRGARTAPSGRGQRIDPTTSASPASSGRDR
jgi:hypothetical protein